MPCRARRGTVELVLLALPSRPLSPVPDAGGGRSKLSPAPGAPGWAQRLRRFAPAPPRRSSVTWPRPVGGAWPSGRSLARWEGPGPVGGARPGGRSPARCRCTSALPIQGLFACVPRSRSSSFVQSFVRGDHGPLILRTVTFQSSEQFF